MVHHAGQQVAIVVFPSRRMKADAPKSCPGWTVDDTFSGLTILRDPPKPELDICTLHGLNGNAFDTFASQSYMWPLDFLPEHSHLQRSRVMTYGYSSRLRDDSNVSGLLEWASGFLSEVSSVRITQQERSRPIIFVCHSLGGLVAREAMVELDREPKLYPGLNPRHCGLLFLATPHSGVTLADLNPYLVQLAEVAGIRARSFTNMLESFNHSSRTSKRDFGRLPHVPPYECLYETRKMKVGGRKKLIVTADSAGLNGVDAKPMSNVDHKDICRFPSDAHPGYLQIGECLVRIRNSILEAIDAADDGKPPEYLPSEALLEKEDTSATLSPAISRPTSGIRAGEGTGGSISRTENSVVIGGGRATGATMKLRDLQNFRGRVEGGTGHGAVVVM
ncbi:hypothetical protein B0T14DRAFT_570343 [Immersiella caudata]|uniref:DUF676 domain-containing protein n=1 Tax=Immersiella caudata TaxID=314043 RepID=A0AA40BUS6_9PEZI|nr:hypothetical protein B0T14DRAFT_570343 [Immersiella caudata]